MTEATAVQAAPSESAAVPAVPPTIGLGDPVFVSFYDATNKIVNGIGHIIAVNTLDAAGIASSGAPSLTIALPKPSPDPAVFASARWHEQYSRLTGVRHVSHGSHALGGTQAAWQEIDAPAEAYPSLLDDREAPPANPTFTRTGDTKSLSVSLEQAVAAQIGTAPLSSTVSPLMNDPESLESLEAKQRAAALQQEAVTKSIAAAQQSKEAAAAQEASGATRNQGAGLDDTLPADTAGPVLVETPAVVTGENPPVEEQSS